MTLRHKPTTYNGAVVRKVTARVRRLRLTQHAGYKSRNYHQLWDIRESSEFTVVSSIGSRDRVK